MKLASCPHLRILKSRKDVRGGDLQNGFEGREGQALATASRKLRQALGLTSGLKSVVSTGKYGRARCPNILETPRTFGLGDDVHTAGPPAGLRTRVGNKQAEAQGHVPVSSYRAKKPERPAGYQSTRYATRVSYQIRITMANSQHRGPCNTPRF